MQKKEMLCKEFKKRKCFANVFFKIWPKIQVTLLFVKFCCGSTPGVCNTGEKATARNLGSIMLGGHWSTLSCAHCMCICVGNNSLGGYYYQPTLPCYLVGTNCSCQISGCMLWREGKQHHLQGHEEGLGQEGNG